MSETKQIIKDLQVDAVRSCDGAIEHIELQKAELTRLRDEVERLRGGNDPLIKCSECSGLFPCSTMSPRSDNPDDVPICGRCGQENAAAEAGRRACPCLYGDPCSPECGCINEFSSVACSRCCTHGGGEQRAFAAKQIIGDIEAGRRLPLTADGVRRTLRDVVYHQDLDGLYVGSSGVGDWMVWQKLDGDLPMMTSLQISECYSTPEVLKASEGGGCGAEGEGGEG